MTRDHDTVRGWIEEEDHDAIPVRYSGVEGESNELRIVPESEVTDTHEEMTWDDFGRELEQSERVVVYHGEGDFEVIDRDEAATRATVDSEGFEEALLEGETVTSEVTETKVVERTIVEEATIENKVVDRRIIDEEIVEAELLDRELVEFGLLVDDPETIEVSNINRYDASFPPNEDIGVEATLDEEWRLTKERTEELVVESRVVDTEAAETDATVSDDIEASVDTEHVQRSVLQSGMFGDEVGANEIIERGDIRSEYHEGAVVRTQLPVRTMVEEDITVQKLLTGTFTEGETLESATVRETELSSEVVSNYEFQSDLLAAQESREGTEVEGTGTVEGGMTESETSREGITGSEGSREGITDDSDAGMTESEGSVEGMVGSTDEGSGQRPDDSVAATPERYPSEEDEGKQVVNQDGENVGKVKDVRGDTIYVEPDHSLTEKIAESLGWSDEDEDTYPVEAESVTSITDDHVYVSTSSSPSTAT
ncbi:DUF2171 domain-containing protein [Halopelagius longus]|nr:DUF2171 domain-containing protein [Halopelagius longus]